MERKRYMPFVVANAYSEVGYLEKKSNKDLYDKTANAGSNNYTKYAYEFDTKYPNFFNGKKNGAPFCDVFFDWNVVTVYGEDAAHEMIYQPKKSLGAGCKYSYNYYKKNNAVYSVPRVGDQIFFGSAGTATHTGMVVRVDDKKVYTIEGNKGTSNKVAKWSYSLTDKTIVGYGRPKYDALPLPETLPPLRKGSKGEDVRYLQSCLITLGYSCGVYGADGDFGSATYAALQKYQTEHSLTAVGIADMRTWESIYDELACDTKNELRIDFDNLPTLRKGSCGEEVAYLQTKLISLGYSCGKYGADGDFGSATLSAVKAFQKDHGLTVDGIVGSKTRAVLNKT